MYFSAIFFIAVIHKSACFCFWTPPPGLSGAYFRWSPMGDSRSVLKSPDLPHVASLHLEAKIKKKRIKLNYRASVNSALLTYKYAHECLLYVNNMPYNGPSLRGPLSTEVILANKVRNFCCHYYES